VLLDLIVDAVEPALPEPGEIEGRLPQGLAGDGARIYGGPTHDGLALHEGDAAAEIRGLGRSLLAGGAGTEHDQVVGLDGHECHPSELWSLGITFHRKPHSGSPTR